MYCYSGCGAECVIGWTESINSIDAKTWQSRFQSHLIQGYSVLNSAYYADDAIYFDASAMRSWQIFGNPNVTVNATLPTFSYRTSTQSLSDNVAEKLNIAYPIHDESRLQNILKTYFASYQEQSFITKISNNLFDPSHYIVDYIYTHNGYVTNLGYTVHVQNGYIISITEHKSEFLGQTASLQSQQNIEITKEMLQEAYAKATSEVLELNNCYQIINQKGTAYYDCVTNQYFYVVISHYKTSYDTEGSLVTFYQI